MATPIRHGYPAAMQPPADHHATPPVDTPASDRPSLGRTDALILLLLASLVLLPEILLRHWWVDDSAITFGFARNLANGDGLVPFPGGERVEGYSDPLWMLLLALGWLLHLDPFPLSKVLGGLMAAATVPVAWAVARWLPLPTRDPRVLRAVPLLVAALVATNAQQGIWACAGLENSLFSLLLALGAWRLLVEGERGGMPWSAVAFLGAALTHSEGAMYGSFAFVLAAWSDLRQGRRLRVVAWAAAFGLPYLAYIAARTAYFALPYPLPYYAKVADTKFSPLRWTSRCWTYLRKYGLHLGWAVLLPVPLLGVVRARGWRVWVVLAWLAVAGLSLLPQATTNLNLARVALFSAMGLALPLLALRRGEGPLRLLFTGMVVMALGFAVTTNGDWMSGFRRFSVLAVPLAALYAVGLVELAVRLPGRWLSGRWLRGAVVAVLVATPIVWNTVYVVRYAEHPCGMTPMTTRTRIHAFNQVARTLHLDREWVAVDHAMGGHMWYAPPDGRTIDWYGLTDVTFALHRPVPGFAADYLLRPPIFDLAHMEKGFRRTKLFQRLFVHLPRGKGRTWDNWVRRDLLAAPTWPGPLTPVSFAEGHALAGYSLPAPEVHAGGGLDLELGLSRDEEHEQPFGVKVILEGPQTVVLDASPGYDGMFPPKDWRAGEVFHGRYTLSLPKDLPEGRYTLGLALVSAKGVVEPATHVPEGVTLVTEGAAVGPGELRLPTVVIVTSAEEVRAQGEADWQRAVQAAGAGQCEAAEEDWTQALAHDRKDSKWEATLHERAQGPLADCWSARAAQDKDLDAAVAELAHARRWDPRSPSAQRVGSDLADAHWEQAMAAREADKPKRALALFEAIVHADPSRSWARRYAEEARTVLLSKPARKPPADD